MDTHGFLVMMHCGANTGHAVAPLEETCYHTALALAGGNPVQVCSTCPNLQNGPPRNLPDDCHNVREHRIDTALGFDISVIAPAFRRLREALTGEVRRASAACA